MVLLALGVACQRVDLPDNPHGDHSAELPTGEIGSKVTIGFSTADVTGPETRGIVNAKVEVETLHLIVFDENGMLVEVCKAEEHGSSDHDDHEGGKHYSVTLTVTDKPRIIHYIANCPVDQVVYGHETSVIGNMFVDRNRSEGAQTEYEVSYWARIEVPHILVVETEEKQTDGTTKKVLSLTDDIKDLFMHVPLLRNYAEITVTKDENNKTFEVIGFTVYNLLNRGTVAPYNSNTQEFQSFFKRDSNGNITNYLYPEIYKEKHYEGHALTSAQLITDFIRYDEDDVIEEEGKTVGDVKIYKLGQPFYVYERKVSVMTDEEEKWRESPPHIIIKARYSYDGDEVKESDPIYYYKMDLVYTEDDGFGTEEVKYYNILRNFMYDFNITEIHDVGYSTLDEAVDGAAGNNISGSSTTSKLTNVSDDEGRLWVSYTDITLVTGEDVVFRYKYIPNYYGTEGSEYTKGEVKNDLVKFQNIVGDVITGIEIAENDTDGWREVKIHVNEPSDITHQQILYLKTNNSNLNRQIRHTLRKRLTMQVECTPKVPGAILQPVQVDIKLPLGMTEDMFPLALNMETKDRTLSPDAAKNEDPIPVTAGPSIVEGRVGQSSYYYTVTIPTFDAYKALPNDGDMKVVTTYWQTNMAANASTFYVDSKYFNLAYDSWENYQYEFSNVSCSSSAVGVDQDVTIKFSMANGAINKQVTIYLEGMTFTGLLGGVNYTAAKEVTYTPSQQNVTIQGFKTTTATDRVSFTLDADDYNIVGPVVGERQTYQFGGAFAAASLEVEADAEVDFTFNISDDALEALEDLYPDAGANGVPMFVTLDRLHPADDQLIYYQAKAGGDRYIYRIKQSGKQTIKLATTEAAVGDCTVTLEADYFDTESKSIQQVGLEFESLNIKNNRIAQGLGRSVNITFQLADVDNNAQKDVTVTLVNMAVNGKNTFTFNTGDSNAVTNNNGTYTIKNVVTADDPAGELKVTITAKGYSSREATFTKERPVPKITASLSKTRLGTSANQEVVLSFSSEDLVDGMAVTLELDGLKPTADLPTRAVTRYVYTVSGTGEQKVTLLTTEATSRTCSVKLKAEDFGFEDSETLSVVQSNIVTYAGTINVTNANLTFNQLQTDRRYTSSAEYSITVGGKKVDVSNWELTYEANTMSTGSGMNRQYYITGIKTFKIENVSFSGEGINGDTTVEISITITANNNSRTVKYSKKINELGLSK